MKMVKYAFSKGINSGLVTNGTLMTKKVSREYLKYGPRYITFSIDSAIKDEYEKIRREQNLILQ
jgi:MoaA/NifB/PqqE/SkfB family radical SAM enzyme